MSSDNKTFSEQEVIIRSLFKPQFKETIIGLLEKEVYYYVLQAHFDPAVNYSFPNEIIEKILSYVDFDILENGEFIESSVEPGAYSGGDPFNGEWTNDLYKFLDHYIWIECEGEKYGYYPDLETALKYG